MKNYKNLIAWQKGFTLTKRIYSLTETFPSDQRYRLCDQMERASVSIISNIAEGSRRTQAEWKNYVRIALGSASELETQLFLARDLKFGPSNVYDELLSEVDEISRLLSSYMNI
jgi:four helix bundle protein